MTTEPTLELIETYNIGQLRSVATQLGLEVEKTAKKADLLPRIIERLMTVQPSDKVADEPTEAPKPKPSVESVTEDDIKEIVAPYKALGFAYTIDGDVFTFTCRGKQDSGNMRQPRRVVEKVAAGVAKRGFAPKFDKDEGFMIAG